MLEKLPGDTLRLWETSWAILGTHAPLPGTWTREELSYCWNSSHPGWQWGLPARVAYLRIALESVCCMLPKLVCEPWTSPLKTITTILSKNTDKLSLRKVNISFWKLFASLNFNISRSALVYSGMPKQKYGNKKP